MIRIGENTLVASVDVQVSPTFFGWLFQFGSRMQLLSPESVIEAFMIDIQKPARDSGDSDSIESFSSL